MLHFSQNLMYGQMNLLIACQNNSNWPKIKKKKKKKTVAERRISMLSVV